MELPIGTDDLHCAHCGTRVDVDAGASRAVYDAGLATYRESFGRGFPGFVDVRAGACPECGAEVQRVKAGHSTIYTTTHNPPEGGA